MWVRLSLAFAAVQLVSTGLVAVIALLLLQHSMLPVALIADSAVPELEITTADEHYVVWQSEMVVVRGLGLEIPVEILILVSAAISLTLGLGVGVWMARSITKPVSALATAADAVGKRDLSQRVAERGSQELVDLAHAFNRMASELEDAERLRTHLVADVAHELRNPLAILEGNLRAMLDDVFDLTKDEIARLYRQTHHLTRLVEDLRELAHADAGRLQLDLHPAQVDRLVRDIVSSFRRAAEEKGVRLTEATDGELPAVPLDVVRLRQVLHNLVANAIRHTPQGGTVRISADWWEDYLRLVVSDTGVGIPSQDLETIFDRFHRGTDARDVQPEGTGLGLAIARAFVEAHGGRIDADSLGPGHGARFTILLPISGV
jgi:signal transduction histidine kinase